MIDRATVERIKSSADIVEVVSEFVTLRKSGANYKGLCPFHDEKTPSFIVSPARGTCHCFGCGKGGTPVSFIMEHEQMTYPEALRWLAKKYHIEINERELTDEERKEQSERESMFIVNEWAKDYFADLLHNHDHGQIYGQRYFRDRGVRDDIVEKFGLGYDLGDRHALAAAARAKGYSEEFLVKTGICYRNDRGELIDRYAGRVIFPWIGVSGKVVGFGGRLLDARTKGVSQKYVNSPDSEIFHKDRELYGIYQAKKAIAKEDRVYMVEGYTDVIAMHQSGIENVVANSGTALSLHQIRMLHRFTSNITLLYDGDEAGIHAAMRGTDMLLGEGMNLKVLLLPDGDDPDSFARKHTAADFRAYIEEHQTDFIQFKSNLLLRGETDPLKRSEAINSVVQSISCVQNPILRDTYIHDCAVRFDINETTIINTMNRLVSSRRENGTPPPVNVPTAVEQRTAAEVATGTPIDANVEKLERLIAEMVVRHGEEVIYKDVESEDGSTIDLNVAQYIYYNLGQDDISLSIPIYARILDEVVTHSADEGFKADLFLINHDDIDLSRAATDLAEEKYVVTLKTRYQPVTMTDDEKRQAEIDRLEKLAAQVNHLLNDYRMDLLDRRLRAIQKEIVGAKGDAERLRQLMEEYKTTHELRSAMAKLVGSNIVV